MQAQVDIRSWLLRQNDWLQEAADRLLKKGKIDDLDVADLTALIKTPLGTFLLRMWQRCGCLITRPIGSYASL